MKTYKKLLAIVLAVAMICVLAACNQPETPAGNTATVTYMNGTEVYETATVEIGSTLTLPKAPKAEKGKGLIGWTTIEGDVEEVIDPATFVVEADVTLYALWADFYTVVINADNGTPFTVLDVPAGTVIAQPEDPVKEGFKFVEWRDAIAEITYDFSQPIYADITIKAMYGDGAPNRVSDTKWDFSTGIHGGWIGGQGGWNRVDNGINATDMVYLTTEDGYAAWGFTMTDNLENIPEINGQNEAGYGMKFIYNEGISVEASKAKLVVMYVKPKYYPIDIYGDLNDQFRISILTSNGGMIYGYGTGSEDWTVRSDGGSKNMIQADVMEDGWIRVQFKISGLKVWSEDAILKSMSISMVQRPSTPVMDIIAVKSIELLDQEEFIDPHKIDYVTNNKWDMSKEEESNDWFGVMQTGSNTTSVTTTIDANGTKYVYGHSNAWRGMTLNLSKIDISKCSGTLAVTMDVSGMNVTNYRVYIVTDKGGDLYKNSGRDDVACYYAATSATDLADGWTVIPNADGTITVYYDLTKLEYWTSGTELQGMSFVTVDATTNGAVVYKSISLVDTIKEHNCATEGHIMSDATCDAPKTCAICGATEGEPAGHSWVDATCKEPKHCSVCGEKDGATADHTFVDGACSACGASEFVPVSQNKWELNNEKDAADWDAYHAMKLNEALTSAVTANGLEVTFTGSGNGWKGISLDNAAINIAKLTGKLTFTYSSDMAITAYRVYILTDKGGDLLNNNVTGMAKENYYAAPKVADIEAGTVTGWTKTANDDGSITVTVDLTTLPYYAEGTELKGLTICTITANKTTGTVAYKSIELEKKATYWDMKDAEDSADWYATQDKDTKKTGSITVTEAGSVASYADINAWKGMLLREQEIAIADLEGVLSFTYKTDMPITNFRIYVLSDKGGSLTHNNVPDAETAKVTYYVDMSVANIASSEAWTSTVNEDGTTTVTFDLKTVPFYAEGTVLNGLSIITVSGKVNGAHVTGDVLYTDIAIN